MSRQKIGRVVLNLCVNRGEMVLLKTKVPSFDTSWWPGLGIVENQFNWLTISVEDKVSTKQVCSRSIAHTIARASRSVWEYLSSTGVSDLLTYATILRSSCPGVRCERIADNPYGEASVVSSDSLFLSK